jgi:adenylylsulfate kinase-like enzyme
MVVWIIGLSGSGKTTLATKVVAEANAKSKKTILIDGDVIRQVFGNDIGYSTQERLLNAQRICQLGEFLDSQGVNVVCAILSIFPETRKWNRENVNNYFEVYIEAPIDSLINRDSKGIYGKYKRGEISDVVGMNIKFPAPDHADMVIDNSKSVADLLSNVDSIVNILRK